jgi:5-methyltetrahydropteroyltriglutamate--homocysteine methyltransferase
MRGRRDGTVSTEQLRRAEDDAVRSAIALQESVGLDLITDGEMRREGWVLSPYILDCFDQVAGPRSYPAGMDQVTDSNTTFPTVARRLAPPTERDLDDGYALLRANTTGRVKFTLPTPSYHRRFWNDAYSTAAYDSCEEWLADVRDWVRGVARRLAENGCDYIQLDSPNYGSLCDPEVREYHRSQGHDIESQLEFDGAMDSSVFEGLSGVTRALHLCRGNLPGGKWFASGGYAAISERLFPALSVDVMLMEFDSDRAGDFGPLREVPDGVTSVLGLLTTKNDVPESEKDVLARIESAATLRPLDKLALSTQCGFASMAGGNPSSLATQRAKLETVVRLARQVWG